MELSKLERLKGDKLHFCHFISANCRSFSKCHHHHYHHPYLYEIKTLNFKIQTNNLAKQKKTKQRNMRQDQDFIKKQA